MKRSSIWIIIGLMSIALIGIIFIQIFWINWFVRLNEKNFDYRVYTALSQVRLKLTEEVEQPIDIKILRLPSSSSSSIFESNKLLDDKYGNALSKYNPFMRQKLIFELRSLNEDFNPQELLYRIKPENLGRILREAIQNQGIYLDFDFGVYSSESQDFFLVNDSYVPTVSNPDAMSTSTMLKSLYNSKYTIQLFTTEFENPGHLAIFFKNRRSFLWSSVMPWLMGSILFTGLILFCFSYVIYVVFRQKKVGAMKTDFINNMTHEFKTPIATINLASDAISSDKIIDDPEKVKKFTSIIKQENTRMLNQVEKVLQIAQIEKNEFELKLVPTDIRVLIEDVIENNELKIKAKNGIFNTSIEIADPMFTIDSTHVSNILNNLLDNANKYSPEGPRITFKATDSKQGLYVSIQDEGIGMTKEQTKYIFDKFYRVHTGNLHDVKGFGLGLSYVKVMTEAHHGKITVESKLGQGSTFHLFLPRTQD